jgi:hypothetical protein
MLELLPVLSALALTFGFSADSRGQGRRSAHPRPYRSWRRRSARSRAEMNDKARIGLRMLPMRGSRAAPAPTPSATLRGSLAPAPSIVDSQDQPTQAKTRKPLITQCRDIQAAYVRDRLVKAGPSTPRP